MGALLPSECRGPGDGRDQEGRPLCVRRGGDWQHAVTPRRTPSLLGLAVLQHVLTPRVKATHVAFDSMKDYLDAVYDVTVAFEGTVDGKGQRKEAPSMVGESCVLPRAPAAAASGGSYSSAGLHVIALADISVLRRGGHSARGARRPVPGLSAVFTQTAVTACASPVFAEGDAPFYF